MSANIFVDRSLGLLMVGTYSGLNKGDRLMQQVVAKRIKDIDASIDIVLASPFPEIDSEIYKSLRVARSRRRNIPLSFFKIMLLIIFPTKLKRKFSECDKELREYTRASLIVDLSGDMLTEDYGPHVAISHLFPLIFSVLLKKKYIVLAQSIGPFKYLKSLFVFILSRAVCVTARDHITYEYLISLGLTNVVEVADLGFLLETEKISYEVKSGTHEKIRIGICPSSLLLNKFGSSMEDDALVNLCKRLEDFAEKYNCFYELIPHVMTPSGAMDDEVLCVEMSRLMSGRSRVISKDYGPSQIKSII